MRALTLCIGLISSSLAASTQGGSRLEPSLDSAKANAHHIFNAVHSAGRQWGAALNHNGFSFFPAVVPRGTILYHGSRYTHPPPAFEWLAFEIEHSEAFAVTFPADDDPRHPPEDPKSLQQRDGSQTPLGAPPSAHEPHNYSRGYLQTYRANRDLNLLYVDGLSAGKTSMGTLDSQDLVLLENNTATSPLFNELTRAQGLCELASKWGYDGIMRTEIGFEVIYCDFSTGLNQTSAMRSFKLQDRMRPSETMFYHWARAAGERYDGLMADRLRIDFSSMVSGFFFPINISNTDETRPDLIRLAAAKPDHLKDIKAHVEHVSKQPRKFTINWQGVVDMITTRYSDGLALMNWDEIDVDNFIEELEHLTLTFVDAPPAPGDVDPEMSSANNETLEAVDRCINNYLLPALLDEAEWSPEDKLIYTAVKTVVEEICNGLFTMRSILLDASPDHAEGGYRIIPQVEDKEFQKALEASRGMTKNLVERLAWTDWKKTRRCRTNEVMFVAMWPFGKVEDHWEPGCRTIKEMREFRAGYWNYKLD